MTMAEARVLLARDRLHDASYAQWPQANLNAYLNSAIQRTLRKTRSYLSTQSIAVVAGTHSYDASPVFKVEAVRLGDRVLDKRRISDMPAIQENWDGLANGEPKRWVAVGGTRFRIAPAPSSAYASMIGSVAASPTAGGTGYAAGDILSITTGGSDGKVRVVSVNAGVVTEVALHTDEDEEGRTVHYRGSGYTTGIGKATSADTGSGTGCTVNIEALAKLEAYGPGEADDIVFTTACTMAMDTDLVSATAHGLAAGDPIEFGGTTGGVSINTTYYVIASGLTADVFKFSATLGGSAFNITANGSNTFGNSEISGLISDARRETYLKAAEEEARLARPRMPGALETAALCRVHWLEECALLEADVGIV